jgi:Polyketide cyclase / dehydrase and lipid transport
VEIPAEAEIHCSAERISDLIIDLGGQDRWLKKSPAFRGTVDVSSDPVSLGTTYREPGPLGVRHGTVTEFERPTSIVFHQMTLRLGLGTVDVVMRYSLSPGETSTRVARTVTLGIPPPLRLLKPILAMAFRTESARTLRALKAYADWLP